MKSYYYCFLLLSFTLFANVATELITMSILGGATIVASGWFKWDSVKDNTICRFTECCNDAHVPYDMAKLKLSLSQRIFGQPLVMELVNILTAHRETMINGSNKKALVISLHGWAGVGKNYATTMIAEALFAKGMNSQFVKMYMGTKDFDCSDLDRKKQELISTVNNLVKKCPMSLIIFDEIHKMCPPILDVIKPMLDHHHAVDGVDYRNSVFVFISNIGGPEISETFISLYEKGVKRNEVEFHDFESIIRKTAFFQGGFLKAAVISHHLIDHYVPFLPLEQIHVEMCALSELRAHGIYTPSKEMMADALSVITYGPTEEQPIFANNGCKRFAKHIPYIVQKHATKEEFVGTYVGWVARTEHRQQLAGALRHVL